MRIKDRNISYFQSVTLRKQLNIVFQMMDIEFKILNYPSQKVHVYNDDISNFSKSQKLNV
jgi:hypothetical protein